MNPPTITVSTLREMLERHEPITVLDIRPAAQREEWSIPGSLHVDAYDALRAGDGESLARVELPADQTVVAVCAAGNTSLLAADHLRRRGIKAVSLAGGMRAWSLAWNAAELELKPATPGAGALVVQVRRTGKGCLSYVIGSGGEAVAIDPSVDVEIYQRIAAAHHWNLRRVIETHVHADHLSRARELARVTGAELHLPEQDRVQFPFSAIKDGDVLSVGRSTIEALHTPGHTFESTCYLLDQRALLTGDTLFVNAVGRPDLKADAKETARRAHALYGSLQRLLALPGETLILSCHTSGPIPFDGRPVVATLAEARQAVPLLGEAEDGFVDALLRRIPATPPNHLHIVGFNEAGELPAGDVTRIEAGANRCAVA